MHRQQFQIQLTLPYGKNTDVQIHQAEFSLFRLMDKDSRPAVVLSFKDSDRAVPLTKHVISAPIESRNPYTFDLGLSHKLPAIIKEYSQGKPTLIVHHICVILK